MQRQNVQRYVAIDTLLCNQASVAEVAAQKWSQQRMKSEPKPRPSSILGGLILCCGPLFQSFSASCCKRHSPGEAWVRPWEASSRQKQQQCWMATDSWCIVAVVSVSEYEATARSGFVKGQQQRGSDSHHSSRPSRTASGSDADRTAHVFCAKAWILSVDFTLGRRTRQHAVRWLL
jgi:hypothetical protein